MIIDYYGDYLLLFIFFFDKISQVQKSIKKNTRHQKAPKGTKKHQKTLKSNN